MDQSDQTDGSSGSASGVKAVGTSFEVIDTIKKLEGAKVTEIVDETGLSKGAVYKHLSTLIDHDFVIKNGSEYNLGFRFLDYGGWLRRHFMGSRIIKSQIQDLADETNEVAMFATLENAKIITLFRENGSKGVLTRTRLGRRLYPHQTAGGKAILSQLPLEEVRDILDTTGLPQATENTITEKDTFLSELETVRDRGYAFNLEESTKGVVAVAVPLVPNDRAVGACSVTGPRHRMNQERLHEDIAPLLLSIVNQLELNITHSQRSGDMFEFK